MADLHDLLEREGELYALPPGAAERMFERGRRRERNRRAAAIGLGALLLLAVIAIVRSGLPSGDESRPAVPSPVTQRSVAGTYSVDLSRDEDDSVRRLHLDGTYEMHLDRDGSLQLSSPHGYDLPGTPITFMIDAGVMTTDALVGTECDAPGRYLPLLQGGILSFRPLDEPCELRRVLLATRPWGIVDDDPDRLEGDWTATFSCEQMVRTVRAAPVSRGAEGFWAGAAATELGSGDSSDPCASTREPMTFTLRFSNGHLWIFDGADMTEGLDGDYELLGGGILRFGDGIDGPFRASFEIDGDQVTFDLLGRGGSDAFFVATWESAPFVKRA